MKPRRHRPDPDVEIVRRLIAASLVGGNGTQACEARFAGWRVIAFRERCGDIDATAWPPRGRALNIVARGAARCAAGLVLMRERGRT